MKQFIFEYNNSTTTVDIAVLSNITAEELTRNLPISSSTQTWGDEIYFDTNITAPCEKLTVDVNVGDIAYWPQGKCLCVFFGKTPMSSDDKPVPASEVVIVGKTTVDPEVLKQIPSGAKVTVT